MNIHRTFLKFGLQIIFRSDQLFCSYQPQYFNNPTTDLSLMKLTSLFGRHSFFQILSSLAYNFAPGMHMVGCTRTSLESHHVIMDLLVQQFLRIFSQADQCSQNFEVFLDLSSTKSWNFVVLNVFSVSSQNVHRVPNVFPNMFTIALTRATFFSLSFTLVTYITSPKEEITTYWFQARPKIDFLFFFMAQSKMLIRRGKNLNFDCPHN